MIVTVIKERSKVWHRFKITGSIDPPINRTYCEVGIPDNDIIGRYQYDTVEEAILSPIFTSVDSVWCPMCKDAILRDFEYRCASNEIDHPAHYGGADNPYEAIKVIEAWELGFNLGNCIKYISRAGKKETSNTLVDLQKALWYLRREIERNH